MRVLWMTNVMLKLRVISSKIFPHSILKDISIMYLFAEILLFLGRKKSIRGRVSLLIEYVGQYSVQKIISLSSRVIMIWNVT